MAEQTVKVKLRQGFSAPNWGAERGDEIEVALADARRMVTRGLAGRPEKEEADKLAFDKAMKMTPAEQQEARTVDHESEVGEHLRIRLGLAASTTKNRR
jgi:hypothetical protein